MDMLLRSRHGLDMKRPHGRYLKQNDKEAYREKQCQHTADLENVTKNSILKD
jgi:hypothetical protein